MKKLNSILLVDDDNPTNFLHQMIIEENNLSEQIHVAFTGLEAIEYLATKKNGKHPCPDIIFLDINMPIMNGWDFLTRYKVLPDEQKASIVIVMLTASLNITDNEKAKKNQEIRDFITKPLTLEKLEKLIEKFF
jgi:CheY-like chemotaxis protein